MHDTAKTFPLDVRHAGDGLTGAHARYHNVYGMQMARATFEGVQKLRPDARPFVLTRAGYAGVQRYSAVWTGDNVPSWEHLALFVPMLMNMGVSGVPFVGADIGGFADTNLPTPELYTRWLQAAALTPFCRAHYNKARGDREPWSFGAEAEKINRASIELRYELLPYLYTTFEAHTESGAPVMRPLWFNYPADYNGYNPPLGADEYLVGDDLLVAPVLQEGANTRGVYFPKGDAWFDWWTGERHEGGTSANVSAPLNRLPLFIRAGASIPTQPVVQNTDEMAHAPLTLTVAAGNGTSRIYEDAGDGYDYRRGVWRTTFINQTANTLHFTRTGAYNTARTLAAIEFVGVNAKPKAVLIDGREAKDVSFDRETKRLRMPLPKQDVSEIALVP